MARFSALGLLGLATLVISFGSCAPQEEEEADPSWTCDCTRSFLAGPPTPDFHASVDAPTHSEATSAGKKQCLLASPPDLYDSYSCNCSCRQANAPPAPTGTVVLPPPLPCDGDRESVATRGLSAPIIRRDVCQQPTPQELAKCTQDDAVFSGTAATPAWQSAITVLRSRAGIASAVPIAASPDLRLAAQPLRFGGGVTGFTPVLVDGKFLEILKDYAWYVAAREARLTADTEVVALNRIVDTHNGLVGYTPDGVYTAIPMPESSLKRADAFFLDLTAAILFHEYGHYWAWACVDRQRAAVPVNPYFFYPTLTENDADGISGALSAKAGRDRETGPLMFDLMALYVLRRSQPLSIVEIQSPQFQATQLAPNYASLAQRKATWRGAYDRYRASGGPTAPASP
jgi:hypothetical protein